MSKKRIALPIEYYKYVAPNASLNANRLFMFITLKNKEVSGKVYIESSDFVRFGGFDDIDAVREKIEQFRELRLIKVKKSSDSDSYQLSINWKKVIEFYKKVDSESSRKHYIFRETSLPVAEIKAPSTYYTGYLRTSRPGDLRGTKLNVQERTFIKSVYNTLGEEAFMAAVKCYVDNFEYVGGDKSYWKLPAAAPSAQQFHHIFKTAAKTPKHFEEYIESVKKMKEKVSSVHRVSNFSNITDEEVVS